MSAFCVLEVPIKCNDLGGGETVKKGVNSLLPLYSCYLLCLSHLLRKFLLSVFYVPDIELSIKNIQLKEGVFALCNLQFSGERL